RPAGGERQGDRRRLQPRAHARRAPDRRRCPRPDRRAARAGQGQGPVRAGGRGHEPDAAARVHAGQHLARLGARLGTAGPGALRHPRQLQLQANRAAAGLRRLLAAPAAAQADRLRVRLPGLRPPGTPRCAARFRPGDEPRSHQAELRESAAMRLVDFLDKGASLHPSGAPCLTMSGRARSYAEVQRLSWSVGRALAGSGVRPGDKVAILSGNDPVAFGCVFGISRAAAVWCPVNPRNEAAENRELLDLFDCRCLIFAAAFAPLVAKIAPDLPGLKTLVCLDGQPAAVPEAVAFDDWLAGVTDEPWQADPVDDVVMIAGTGGTTGTPKGVLLTGHNIETMTALTLMSYPFDSGGPPVYLALAPLTHAAGVLCFPVMTLGGEIVIMPSPDLGEFLALTERHAVTHAFLPPPLIYLLLD